MEDLVKSMATVAQAGQARIIRKDFARRSASTRMHFSSELHTQWFDAGEHKPTRIGRYKVKYAGSNRFVFRFWNGASWQFNRRKAGAECVQPKRGDQWRGLVHGKELH